MAVTGVTDLICVNEVIKSFLVMMGITAIYAFHAFGNN